MAACGAVGRGFKSLWARDKFDYIFGLIICANMFETVEKVIK
jgi:hypothetical protein